MSTHLLDIEWYWTEIGVDIFSMSTLILDREWSECLFYNYTDIGWSGYSSFEYIDIGGSVNLCLEYMYTDIGQRMEWVSFLWVLLWVTDISHDCSLPRRHAFHRLIQLASDKIMLPCRCWLVNHWITRRSFILFLESLNHFRIPDNQCSAMREDDGGWCSFFRFFFVRNSFIQIHVLVYLVLLYFQL